MSTASVPQSEGEQLLEQSKTSLPHLLVPAAALLIDVAVIASGFGEQTVWYLIRASGVIAYVLLTLSVAAGLLITNRVLPAGQTRVDAFEMHNFMALLVFGFVSVHLVGLLLDQFIGFSPVQLFVPLTSEYRPLSVSAGILGLYAAAVVYASLWVRKRIAYKTWRTIHYVSFAAFGLSALHGIFAGTDSGEPWMLAIYAGSLTVVGALTARRALQSSKARPRAVA